MGALGSSRNGSEQVSVSLKLRFTETAEASARDKAMRLQSTREAFEYMRDTLPGQKKVRIYLSFIKGL